MKKEEAEQRIPPTEDSKELHERIEEYRKYSDRIEKVRKHKHNLSDRNLLWAGILTCAATAIATYAVYQIFQYYIP
jgi:hypothetical protein